MQSSDLASRLREVLLDGTWVTGTNYKKEIEKLTWEQATTKILDYNTIADLIFHIDYYLDGVLQVIRGGPLTIRDQYSFDASPILSEADWESRRYLFLHHASEFISTVEKLDDDELASDFVDPKYGTWHRNINVMIEHCYYHLGQLRLLTKEIGECTNEVG